MQKRLSKSKDNQKIHFLSWLNFAWIELTYLLNGENHPQAIAISMIKSNNKPRRWTEKKKKKKIRQTKMFENRGSSSSSTNERWWDPMQNDYWSWRVKELKRSIQKGYRHGKVKRQWSWAKRLMNSSKADPLKC